MPYFTITDLPYDFPTKQLKLLQLKLSKKRRFPAEIKKRKDFRKTLTFTIDPISAKDFDDALSFKQLENGCF
jgi:exoribonuclease R